MAETGLTTGEPVQALEPLIDLSASRIWGMLESAPDAMFMTDADGLMLVVNQQAEVMFGYDRVDLLGRPIDVLLPERFRSVHVEHRARYGAAPTVRAMGTGLSLSAMRSDGIEFPVEISLSPLGDAEGVGGLVVVSVRDISDRIAIEERLAASEAVFRTIFEHAPVGMMLIRIGDDGRQMIERANTALGSMLGRSAESLHSADVAEITHPDDDEAASRAAARLADGESEVHTTEQRFRRSDGSYVWTLLHSSVIDRSAGTLTLAHLVDISDRRARQAERARLARMEDRERIGRDLHDLVIQRLFAAGMRLQSIIPEMRSDVAVARTHETIDELDASIRELRSAIFDLHAPEQSIDVVARIDQVVDAISPTLGFRPSVDAGDVHQVPSVIAEELLSTLREALSNVGRHADATSAHVEVGWVGDQLRLVVSDDGVGITQHAQSGSGMANMISRSERLGGTFEVGRNETGGTTVRWSVPLRSA